MQQGEKALELASIKYPVGRLIPVPDMAQEERLAPLFEEMFLREVFFKHSLKLSAVNQVVDFLSSVIAAADIGSMMRLIETLRQSNGEVTRYLESQPTLESWDTIMNEIKGDLEEAQKTTAKVKEKLKVAGSVVLVDLDELKQKGLFVDYNREAGCFVFPRGLSEKSCESLEELIKTLIRALDALRFVPHMYEAAAKGAVNSKGG